MKLSPSQKKLLDDLLDTRFGDPCWNLKAWSKNEDQEITHYYLNSLRAETGCDSYGRRGYSEKISKRIVDPLIAAGILKIKWFNWKTGLVEIVPEKLESVGITPRVEKVDEKKLASHD